MNVKLLLKGLKTAAVVGSILLLINQHEALFGEAPLKLIPAFLTYCVPFAVFLYGSISKDR